MAIINQTQIKILKEAVRNFKKYSGFAFPNDHYYLDNQFLYFETPHFSIRLKIPALEYQLGSINVFKAHVKGIDGLASYYKASTPDSKFKIYFLNGLLSYISGNYSCVTICSLPNKHSVIRGLKHGQRLFKILSDDIKYIKTAIDFVSPIDEHDGSYTYLRHRNLYMSDRVYATDNLFSYKSPHLLSSIGDTTLHIPRVIANVIKHSDKDIIVRMSETDIEFDNEYFTIFYKKPGSGLRFDLDVFNVDYQDIITVNKRELINSLRSIRRGFETKPNKTTSFWYTDLLVNLNGSLNLTPSKLEDIQASIPTYGKSFTEDLTFNTYGNRFLKILSTIKGDNVTIKIPRNTDASGVLINDTYLLMSFFHWV